MDAPTVDKKTLDKETSDKVSFISFIIPEFAAAYKMKISDAYRYLKNMAGLATWMNVGGLCTQTILFGL